MLRILLGHISAAVCAAILLATTTGCSSKPDQEEQSKEQGDAIQQHFKQKVDRTKPK